MALDSVPERAAERAESLRPFSGLKLLHLKRQLTELLTQFGRAGMFYEYTKHDISHVDEMLAIGELAHSRHDESEVDSSRLALDRLGCLSP